MSAPALDPDLEAPTTSVIGVDAETPKIPQTPHELGAALAASITQDPQSLLAAKLMLQAMIVRVEKRQRGENERGEYAYADLATDVHEVLMPVLTRLGLLWETLPMVLDGGAFVLQYSLTHVASNEWQGGNWPLGSPTATAQAKGSDVTYGRRYALLAALGIAPRNQDDDGKKQRDEQRGGGQQRQNGQQQGGGQRPTGNGGPGGRTGEAMSHATKILSTTSTETADRWCAFVDEKGWERTRVRVPDAARQRLELRDAAPTLRDIAQAQSAFLHARAEQQRAEEDSARAGTAEAAQRDDQPVGGDTSTGADDPWANAPLAGTAPERCGAPTVGDEPCTGVYDPTIGQCTGLADHDLHAGWDDDEPDSAEDTGAELAEPAGDEQASGRTYTRPSQRQQQ